MLRNRRGDLRQSAYADRLRAMAKMQEAAHPTGGMPLSAHVFDRAN